MDSSDFSEHRGLGRLGLLNGLFIGLALAGGLWLPAILSLLAVPVSRLPFLILFISALLVIAICVLAGWFSGRLHHVGASLLIWLVAAGLIILTAGYRAFQLSTYAVWLLEPGLRGLPVFPAQTASVAGILLSGLFVLLALLVLALLQEYRLEGLLSELRPGGGLSGSGWMSLALPALLVLVAGVITGNIFGGRATSRALADMDRAIDVARSYEGDLFALGLEEGINYAALRGVQGQLAGAYTLDVVQVDPETAQTIVAAHFENGAWIHCRFINEQLTFCADASAPYTVGFASFFSGQPPDCDDCRPQATELWANWLAERRAAVGASPKISFVRQRGAHVLMRATGNDAAIACWFEGIDSVRLLSCEEIRP